MHGLVEQWGEGRAFVAPGGREGPALCPCGSTLGEAWQASGRSSASRQHVLCAVCRRRVEQQIERRFGKHRYGGHFANRVPDFIQDCYQRQLLAEGGIKKFIAPSDPAVVAVAFRGWLRVVVSNFCNVTFKKVQHELEPRENPGEVPAPAPWMNPEQAFMQQYSLSVYQMSIERVRLNWQSKGPKKGRRFEAILKSMITSEESPRALASTLGVNDNHLRQLIFELRRDLKLALEGEVENTLDIPVGLERPGIQRLVHDEIQDLMASLRAPDELEPEE